MSQFTDRQKLAWDGMFYSVQRIDLLIVSICGAGIYVCLETLKFLSDKNQDIDYLLKFSGVFFVAGIIVNFLSQMLGYHTNREDYLMCEEEIKFENKKAQNSQLEKTPEEELRILNLDNKSELFTQLTTIFNYSSIGLMSLGLISILSYFLITY